jgi:Rho GTPase-activating protein RGD1
MQKLAKSTADQYAMNDGKAGYVSSRFSIRPVLTRKSPFFNSSFVNAWRTTMKIHDIIAENRLRFASRLNEMSEELATLAKEVDKNRKAVYRPIVYKVFVDLWPESTVQTKDLATRYERNLQDSEVTTEKGKARLDATMEELDRILLQKEGEPAKDSVIQTRTQAGGKRAIGKAVAKGGLLLKGKNPGNVFSSSSRSHNIAYRWLQIQRQEDDIRARVQSSSQAYHKSVQETQTLRQEYFNFQLPRILRVRAFMPPSLISPHSSSLVL